LKTTYSNAHAMHSMTGKLWILGKIYNNGGLTLANTDPPSFDSQFQENTQYKNGCRMS